MITKSGSTKLNGHVLLFRHPVIYTSLPGSQWVSNGATGFQQVMNVIIVANNLQGTYAYMDDLTICGKTKDEHDKDLEWFWEVARAFHLTVNENKCKLKLESVTLLGRVGKKPA